MARRAAVLVSAILGAFTATACDDDTRRSSDAGGGPADVATDRSGDVPQEGGTGMDAADAADGVDAGDTADGATDGGGDLGPPLAETQSFTTAATVTLTPRVPGVGPSIPPVAQDVVVRIDPVMNRATLGTPGTALVVELRPGAGGTLETTASFRLPLLAAPACSAILTVERLAISARRDALSATGAGRAEVIFGDVVYAYDAAVSLAGSPDVTGPTLGPGRTGIDPLAELALVSSEPLPPQATARLALGADRVALPPATQAGLVTAFARAPALALRYGASYTLEVDAWRDLAGNAGQPLPAVSTLPAPDLAAEDGFETAGVTLGGAAVVQAPAYPVIAGTKSVLITPSGSAFGLPSRRFTVRLARAANDAVVRVKLRPLAVSGPTVGNYEVSLRIAVPGGAIVSSVLPTQEEVPTRIEAMPPRGVLFAGETRTVEIALPAMTGPEIVFDLLSQNPPGCGLFPPTAGYLIDDLRID
jgi:hypothetical protein